MIMILTVLWFQKYLSWYAVTGILAYQFKYRPLSYGVRRIGEAHPYPLRLGLVLTFIWSINSYQRQV